MGALPGGQVVGAGTGTSWEGQGEPRGQLTDQRRESALSPSTVVLKSEAWYQRGEVNLEEAETRPGTMLKKQIGNGSSRRLPHSPGTLPGAA